MAGASIALQCPTVRSPSAPYLHQTAAFRCQTSLSSITRLWLSDHQRQNLSLPLRTRVHAASSSFRRVANSCSVLQCSNPYRHKKPGFSLAASSNDWASVGTRSSEADPADKGWTSSASDSPESGGQAQDALNEFTSEATAASEKGAEVTKDEVLKAGTSIKDETREPSNKFMGVLRDTPAELKEHAEKARAALAATAQKTAAILAATAQETAEKSKENLSYLAENAPDPIREIADTALKAHSADTPKKFAKIHDFCLGIPYGTMLVIGGLFWFIISGSTAPIRFGVLFGGILLALSVTSLSAWKGGQPTTTYVIGQGAISAILALRQIRRFWEVKASFSTALFTLVSAGMLGFYCYVLLAGGNSPPKKTEHVPAV